MALINNKQEPARAIGFTGSAGNLVMLLPGWNEISQEDLDTFKDNTRELKYVKNGIVEYGPIKKVGDKNVGLSFLELDPEAAEAVIAHTASIEQLEKWRASCKNDELRLSLAKRIEYVKDYKAQTDLDADLGWDDE